MLDIQKQKRAALFDLVDKKSGGIKFLSTRRDDECCSHYQNQGSDNVPKVGDNMMVEIAKIGTDASENIASRNGDGVDCVKVDV